MRIPVLLATAFAVTALPRDAGRVGTSTPLPDLGPDARALFTDSMNWVDRAWDERAKFIWSLDRAEPRHGRHLVRETSWYALGLLQREQPSDRARAIDALNAVLAQQIREPAERWDGTFYRSPEEPHPPVAGYDPNWREFIGTTFSIILLEFRDRLPAELNRKMELSIVDALEGEIKEKRLKPSYTNIALMYGYLWNFAATRLHRPDWIKPSEEWIREVYRGFKEHGAFNEFNSPTYYGVDLYGLALWRTYGSTREIREMGSEMEADLWRSIASFYHAGLKNIAGPYDRSYGMDMRRYVSVVGLFLRTVLPADSAPFPDLKEPLSHANDLIFTPLAIAVPTKIPPDAMPSFREFQHEHLVKQAITGNRVATAWIANRVAIGGEFTAMSKDANTPASQFHPATIHWNAADEEVGWIRLMDCPRVDASVEPGILRIQAVGKSQFRIAAPGLQPAQIEKQRWTLPGLTVIVDTDAELFNVSQGNGYVDAIYGNATRFVLRVSKR
ncbi:MAG: hypothetical protein JOZ62_13430 [Acidobacteriaceae bacterium]|nr:hypothetical protein [Acidobacteriaceae bacterium]